MITANISGRLAFDPREITTKTGKPMTSARVACDDGQDNTIWIDLVAFDNNAVWLARCRKSDRVVALGTLKLNKWTDQHTSEDREVLQLLVDNMLTNKPKPRQEKPEHDDSTEARPVP